MVSETSAAFGSSVTVAIDEASFGFVVLSVLLVRRSLVALRFCSWCCVGASSAALKRLAALPGSISAKSMPAACMLATTWAQSDMAVLVMPVSESDGAGSFEMASRSSAFVRPNAFAAASIMLVVGGAESVGGLI
jgi:hypothetical protein